MMSSCPLEATHALLDDTTKIVRMGAFRIYPVIRLLLAVGCLSSCVSLSEAGLRIYYLRHAEGGHNVEKEWENVPKAQRPAYVGNPNVFTPKGETQVLAVTKRLQRDHFGAWLT